MGTTLGAVVPLTVTLPEPALRASRAPGLSAGGAVLRLKGAVLALSFLDCNGALIPYSYERDRTPTRQGARTSPTPAELAADRQFVVVASEKQARVVALPSQNCVHRQRVVDVDFVVKAEIVSLKGRYAPPPGRPTRPLPPHTHPLTARLFQIASVSSTTYRRAT